MAFGYDAEDAGSTPLKAGDYEVYPSSYVTKKTKQTNNDMAVINYRVRKDVEQPGKGQLIQFDNFVDSPKSRWRFNALTKATDAYEDHHDFGNMENWAKGMMGKPVMVRVKLSEQGYAEVSSFAKSKSLPMTETPQVKLPTDVSAAANRAAEGMAAAQQQAPVPPDPFAGNSKAADIKDEDLPF